MTACDECHQCVEVGRWRTHQHACCKFEHKLSQYSLGYTSQWLATRKSEGNFPAWRLNCEYEKQLTKLCTAGLRW